MQCMQQHAYVTFIYAKLLTAAMQEAVQAKSVLAE